MGEGDEMNKPPIDQKTRPRFYLLRNIPPDLKRAAEHRCIDDGITLRDMILAGIELYLKQKPIK